MGQFILHTFSRLGPSDWILLVLLLVLFLLNLLVLILFYGRLAFLKNFDEERSNPLSLMMPIRNEEDNLKENLPGLLTMGKGTYELVVVDDFSNDSSLLVLGALKREHPRLRFSVLSQETRYSEKIARNIALKASAYDWTMIIPSSIVQTGAQWPERITSLCDQKDTVAVGYSNVLPERSFYNLLYRIEFLFQQLRSFGSIISGIPYVATEDNVAFRRGSYFETGGFRDRIANPFLHMELIINSFIKKKETVLILSHEASIYRKERITRDHFMELLKKEASLHSSLSKSKRWVTGAIGWIYMLFLPLVLIVIITIPNSWSFVLVMVVPLMLGYSLIMKKILHRLGEGKLFLSSLLLAMVLPYYKKVCQIVFNNHHRKRRWKGRN